MSSGLMAAAVLGMATLHEVLVVAYTRAITKGSVPAVMLFTLILSISASVSTVLLAHDSSFAIPTAIGHTLGVPLGFLVPVKRKTRLSGRHAKKSSVLMAAVLYLVP